VLFASLEGECCYARGNSVTAEYNRAMTRTHLGSNQSKPWHMSMQNKILHSEKQSEKHVCASVECHGCVLLDCGVTADPGNVSCGASCWRSLYNFFCKNMRQLMNKNPLQKTSENSAQNQLDRGYTLMPLPGIRLLRTWRGMRSRGTLTRA
jgi:hypothetical protein